MCRIIPLTIDNKNIVVQKETERYIPEGDIKEVIKDIIENNLEMPLDKLIDLSNLCDFMFSIMYKGIVTIIESINDIQVPINNIVFEVC